MSGAVCGHVLEYGGDGEPALVCALDLGHPGDHGPSALGADLPESGENGAQNGKEGASAAQDAPETASGDATPERIAQTAPNFPVEVVVGGTIHWLQKLPGGGMAIKICAATPGQNGPTILPPAYVFEFDAVGWQKFKRSIATDGEAPDIAVASSLPGGMLGG